jgi:hypothetical protein
VGVEALALGLLAFSPTAWARHSSAACRVRPDVRDIPERRAEDLLGDGSQGRELDRRQLVIVPVDARLQMVARPAREVVLVARTRVEALDELGGEPFEMFSTRHSPTQALSDLVRLELLLRPVFLVLGPLRTLPSAEVARLTRRLRPCDGADDLRPGPCVEAASARVCPACQRPSARGQGRNGRGSWSERDCRRCRLDLLRLDLGDDGRPALRGLGSRANRRGWGLLVRLGRAGAPDGR